ncbi:MAG TPA: DUF4870 domain-containing protein [Aggregatilinea sp.]|uniref:DUF4870 domain-containing protein n=1 Tax=Aggregatilinea sp. TaxID=2806333 RepID=UPI002C08124F|nr:DUF4870 domain-containing protein [Aggregatilinea sp.]HML20404.1 DUF4870 domain-containing protein [Aggregatilinea sp.]
MEERDQNPNASDNITGTPAAPNDPIEGVPVPDHIRQAVEGIKSRLGDDSEGEQVVREYQDRYYPDPPERRNRLEAPMEGVKLPPVSGKPKRKAWESPVHPNERKWAALAHASTLLTALVALPSVGTGVLFTMFVPLLIYFAFRKRSQYVAFHALQAFTIQLVGTVGFMSLLIGGAIVWGALLILSMLLILLLVGFILTPIVLVLALVYFVATFALPVAMVIYSVIAAVETWNGRDYRYPYIARWVEGQTYVRMA